MRRKLIKNTNNLKELRKIILEMHPADFANIFPNLKKHKRSQIYKALLDEELAMLFSYLDNPSKYFEELDANKVVSILNNLEIDDLANIFNSLDENEIKLYLPKLDKEIQSHLKYIEKIQDDKVGRIIQTNYISVEEEMDVKEAMKRLIKDCDEETVIDPIFVTSNGKLTGIISLNDLIIARSPCQLKDIMEENPISIDINESIENATNIIHEYSLNALPILDNGKLMGVITSDDAFEIYSEIADTKYASLAGVSSDNLSNKKFLSRLWERLPWLIGLLFLSIIITNVMSIFEDIIKQITILIFFQTLILDMAGNVGTQTLASTIQTLVKDDKISNSEAKKHIFKEIKLNVINSLILMIIAFIVCFIFISIYGTTYSKVLLALIIALSMGITLIVSAFFGTILPIFFSKIKVNPAVASGPLITTINDIISILIYFNLAGLLLKLI